MRLALSILVIAPILFAPSPDLTKKKSKQLDAKKMLKARLGLDDLSGYYTCIGKEPTGKPYTGITVLSRQKDVYIVSWTVGLDNHYVGIGRRKGDSLVVGWASKSKTGIMRGVNWYKINPGPKLVGEWTSLPGPGVMMPETLTFLKKLD